MSLESKVATLRSGNGRIELANRRRARRGEPELLLRRPLPDGVVGHAPRRINALLAGLGGATDYLEIGVRAGRTLGNVRAPHRVGVDPAPIFDVNRLPPGLEFHAVTSDAYFAALDPTTRFDLVFVDGLHTFAQTYRDVRNSLSHLADGIVLIDDTVPDDECSAEPDRSKGIAMREGRPGTAFRYHGDVWKVVVALDRHHPELSLCTITTGGNAQTIVWRSAPEEPLVALSPEDLDAIGALDYSTVMGAGVPEWFHPADEESAIRTALAAVAPRRA